MANIFRNVTISNETVSLKMDRNCSHSPSSRACEGSPKYGTELTSGGPSHARDDENARSEGYAQGFSAGVTQEHNRQTEKENKLDTLLQSIPTAINENRLLLTTEIADIVLLITQQLFINQQQNKESLVYQITQIITQLNEKHNIEIALHPEDVALLQHVDLRQCKNMRILADETLRLGGCVVSSEHGVFNAGIERQIDNLKLVLLQMKQGEARE